MTLLDRVLDWFVTAVLAMVAGAVVVGVAIVLLKILDAVASMPVWGGW